MFAVFFNVILVPCFNKRAQLVLKITEEQLITEEQRFKYEQNECHELVKHLQELMQLYPNFESKKLLETDYLRSVETEIEEHHCKITLIADLLFKKLDETYFSANNQSVGMKV